MQAFAQSVHLVLNPMDLPNLTAILKKGLAENELLYGAYDEILAALGGGRGRRAFRESGRRGFEKQETVITG